MPALEKGVVGRDAEYAQHLNKVLTQQRTVVRAQQDVALDQVQSRGTSVVQPVWPCEMLARLKESDGDDDKLLAEYQQDIESGQPREVRQEFKGCVAELPRVCLQAERECCVMVLQNQLNVDNCDYERMSERIAHTSVAPNEVCGGTQLTRGKLRICATEASETKQPYLWRLEKCEVRIKAWEARVLQFEALGAARECRLKLVSRLKQARIVDDTEDECDEEIILNARVFPHRTVSLGASRSGRQTERDV